MNVMEGIDLPDNGQPVDEEIISVHDFLTNIKDKHVLRASSNDGEPCHTIQSWRTECLSVTVLRAFGYDMQDVHFWSDVDRRLRDQALLRQHLMDMAALLTAKFKTMKGNESEKKMSYFDSGMCSIVICHPHGLYRSRLEKEKERGMEQPKRFWQLSKGLETLKSINWCSPNIEPKKNKGRDIYEMKKCLSDLTCLLTDDVPGGGILNYRTGRVADVIQYKGKDMKKCACAACSLSECPKDKWWNVRVHTCSSRNHDPGNVKLTLFYDHVDSHVTTLQNGSTLFENRKRDISWIDFPTCDHQLATLLGKMVDSFNSLSGELTMKYRDREGGNNLVIIVSHPFGLPKFVSIGRLIEESQGQEKNPKRYKYTNPTFPGTDGAHVFVLGK